MHVPEVTRRHPSTLAAALALATLANGCALPTGSNARPVIPIGEDKNLISIGGLVPFAVAGAASGGDDGASFSNLSEGFVLVPAIAYDRALGEGHSYLGVEVSLLNQFTTTIDTTTETSGVTEAFGVFVNPRFETELHENWSFTIDGNIGYFTDGDTGIPWFAPAFGVRGYVPTGFGGLVFSQQIGTAFITVTLPGSLAYDIPIPVGDEVVLHVFPEVKWDPTFFFTGPQSGAVALFSGGGTVMLEF